MYDIRLKTLLHIVEVKSYTAVARILNLTQPAISKHISSLEKEYHLQIFKDKKFNLTDEGKILVQFANDVLKEYEDLENKLVSFNNEEKYISIGLSSYAYEILLNQNMLSQLLRKFNYQIDFKCFDSNNLTEDFYISSFKEFDQAYNYYPLFKENVCLICSNDLYEKYSIDELLAKNYLLVNSKSDYLFFDFIKEFNNAGMKSFKGIIENGYLFNFDKLITNKAILLVYESYLKNSYLKTNFHKIKTYNFDLNHTFYLAVKRDLLEQKEVIDLILKITSKG